MNVLFVHNNLPAQFRGLIGYLTARPEHSVAAIGSMTSAPMPGVRLLRYGLEPADVFHVHPFARRFNLECRRAEQVLYAATALKESGFLPDIVFAHCGWGENIPLRAAFPHAKLVIYCEYYYRSEGQDVHFEEERERYGIDGLAGLACQNASSLIALADCDLGISPTHWQRSTYPREFQGKISVVHEGVDTATVRPNPLATFTLPGGRKLSRKDEVVTYLARSLEPMRGFHIFLRAAPEILKSRPNAEIVIVGSETASYGPAAPHGSDWKSYFLREMLPSLDLSRVHFLDRVPYDDFISLLQISSVHVYLTYPFVLSWSFVEAMSAGCKLVASDTAPVREVIENGRNGLLVPFHDSDAVASAVVRVIEEGEIWDHLGVAARETAVERFERDVCLPRALELLGIPDTPLP